MSCARALGPLAVLLLSSCTFELKPDKVVIETREVIVAGGGDTGAAPDGDADETPDGDDTGDAGGADGGEGEDPSGEGEDTGSGDEGDEGDEEPVAVAVSGRFALRFTEPTYGAQNHCTGAYAAVVTPGEAFVVELDCDVDASLTLAGFDYVEEARSVKTSLLASPSETGWTAWFSGGDQGIVTRMALPPCQDLEVPLTLSGSSLVGELTTDHATTAEVDVPFYGRTPLELSGLCEVTLTEE